jgi:hypothetical protein
LERLGVIICLTTMAIACNQATPRPQDVVLSDVIVTRDDPQAPPGCQPADVAQFVIGFLDHLATGKVDIDRFFVPAESFSWYSATTGDPRGEGHRFWGKDLDRLPNYFSRRHRQRERMVLRTIMVRSDPESETANVVFELGRTADDLDDFEVDHDTATGKGGIDCATDRIIQWSIFQPEEPDGSTTNLCPDASVPAEDKAIACAPA